MSEQSAESGALTDDELNALGLALFRCIPAVSGYPSGSTAEFAAADQAAYEWLRPVVEAIVVDHMARVIPPVKPEPTGSICPECRAAKHLNCTGEAWDDELDGPAACRCPADAALHAHG